MNIPARAFEVLLLATLTLSLGACGGGAPAPDPDPPVPDPGPGPAPQPVADPEFPNFPFTPAEGDYWEYRWDAREQTFAQGSGSSTNSSKGRFRLTLGAPVMLAGVPAFPIELTGNPAGADGSDSWNFTPRWTHVGFQELNLVGSSDGVNWTTIFDADLGRWTGGGFFTEFPNDTLIVAGSGSISNDYIDQPAIRVGRSTSQSQCETIAGVTICGDESFTISQSEYYEAGTGVLGYFYHNSSSFSGGGFFTSFNTDYNVGLTSSSRRSETLDYLLEREPNNDPASNAQVVTLPAKLMGAGVNEEAYGGGTLIPNETEPNQPLDMAQAIGFPDTIVGRAAVGDDAMSIPIAAGGGFGAYTATFEDFYEFAAPGGTVRVLLEFPGTSADLDLYVFKHPTTMDYFARSITDNASNPSESVTVDLEAGTYQVAIDAYQTDSGPADYTLRVYESSPPSALELIDWYAFDLAAPGSVQITVTGESSAVLTDSTAATVLGEARSSGGTATLSSAVLAAGRYLVGVTQGVAPEDEYTIQIQ